MPHKKKPLFIKKTKTKSLSILFETILRITDTDRSQNGAGSIYECATIAERTERTQYVFQGFPILVG